MSLQNTKSGSGAVLNPDVKGLLSPVVEEKMEDDVHSFSEDAYIETVSSEALLEPRRSPMNLSTTHTKSFTMDGVRRRGKVKKMLGICGEPANLPKRAHYDGVKYISAKYESLDYEQLDNDALLQEKIQKHSRHFWFVNFLRWVVTFVIGALTALIACGIDIGIEKIAEGKFLAIKAVINWIDKNPEQQVAGSLYVFLTWLSISIGLVSVVAFLVAFIEPVAAGSGIPEIKCYLNGIKVERVVRLKTLFVKATGVLFSVAGGLAVGKEGPMIHGGAAVAAGVSQGRLTTYKLDCTNRLLPAFRYYRNDPEKRDFVASGAAAGVAAAFGAPIGGVLFSLEEGASFVNQGLTWRMFFASMSSVFTLNVILSAYHNHPGDLTYNGLINFGRFPVEEESSYEWFEIPIFIFLGAIGGLLGALFNFINYHLTLFRRRYIRTRILRFLEPLIVITMTVTVSFMTVFLSPECQPIGTEEAYQDTFGGTVKLFCGEGEYNAIATLFLSTPEDSIKNLFHDPKVSYNVWLLVIFFVSYYFLACWTYGLMVSSGLFVPSLLVGASWGRVFGRIINDYFPIPYGYKYSSPGRYALIGASAMLGGVVRMTISLTVIIMEATQDLTYGLPIMLSIMVSKWVGDLFTEGLYDIHIELNSIPLLPWEPSPHSEGILATDVMSTPVVTFKTTEKVKTVINVLKTTKHNGFPVVEGDPGLHNEIRTYGNFRGLILRSQIVILLKYQMFGKTRQLASAMKTIGTKEFSEAYPRFPDINTFEFGTDEREMYIDFQPYMNHSTYCAYDDFRFSRLFNQFRYVGLRHLVIVDRQNKVERISCDQHYFSFAIYATVESS
jgi:chloride channel 7